MLQSSTSPALLSRIVAIALVGASTAGCEAVAGIFKAGFWSGIIVVVVLVVGLVAIVAKARG